MCTASRFHTKLHTTISRLLDYNWNPNELWCHKILLIHCKLKEKFDIWENNTSLDEKIDRPVTFISVQYEATMSSTKNTAESEIPILL